MFPRGILGTRADLLMDIVILALVAVVPIVFYNWRLARSGRYPLHKTLQITLAVLLGAVVGLFEYNLRLQGGIFAATAASRYAGTGTLNFWIYFHTFFAITTILVWIGLILVSLRRFPKPPAPGPFSARHRFWGRIGMVWMLVTGVTAIPVYVYGFAL
jgi:putative membrane protein